jgi:arginase
MIITDARDLDPGEKELLEGSDLTHLEDVLELLDFPLPDRPLWVHFDTDVLDPEVVPAQNYPAPGGPGKKDLEKVFQHLAQTGLIRGVSLSSWAPNLPGAESSQQVCLDLLDILLGRSDQ